MADNILGGEDRFGSTNDDLDFETEAPAREETVADAIRRSVDEQRSAEPAEVPERRERSRSEDGRYATEQERRAAAIASGKPVEAAAAEKPASEPATAAAEPLVMRPPVGWNAAAKAEFARLPPAVQESVARREAEVNNGFKVLQEYKGLEEYTPAIKASGLTHAEFTKRAVDWEKSLVNNGLGTANHVVGLVARNMGIPPAQVIRMMIGQVQPGQQQQPQQQRQGAPAPQPVNIQAEVNRQIAQREAEGKVDAFLADPANIHVETVAGTMTALISDARSRGASLDLKQAYDMACYANPEIRATLINRQGSPASLKDARQRQAADQARRAARATVGAPSGLPVRAGTPTHNSVIDAVRAAVAAQRDA